MFKQKVTIYSPETKQLLKPMKGLNKPISLLTIVFSKANHWTQLATDQHVYPIVWLATHYHQLHQLNTQWSSVEPVKDRIGSSPFTFIVNLSNPLTTQLVETFIRYDRKVTQLMFESWAHNQRQRHQLQQLRRLYLGKLIAIKKLPTHPPNLTLDDYLANPHHCQDSIHHHDHITPNMLYYALMAVTAPPLSSSQRATIINTLRSIVQQKQDRE